MKVKGNIVKARESFVKDNFGHEAWTKVVDALPDEDAQVLRGIVTNAATVKAVGPELGTYDVVSAKLQASAKTIHSWQDLTEVEQANLTRAEAAIADILAPHLDNVKAQLQVVDFADKGTEGSCNLGTGEIKIDRGRCTDYFDLMEVMVHEVAHAVSQSGDGQGTHIRTMEIMWRRLYQAACEAQS